MIVQLRTPPLLCCIGNIRIWMSLAEEKLELQIAYIRWLEWVSWAIPLPNFIFYFTHVWQRGLWLRKWRLSTLPGFGRCSSSLNLDSHRHHGSVHGWHWYHCGVDSFHPWLLLTTNGVGLLSSSKVALPGDQKYLWNVFIKYRDQNGLQLRTEGRGFTTCIHWEIPRSRVQHPSSTTKS